MTHDLLVELVAQIRMVGLPPSFMSNVLPHLWWFNRVVPPGEQSRGGKLCVWSLGREIGPIGRSPEWVNREMGLNTGLEVPAQTREGRHEGGTCRRLF